MTSLCTFPSAAPPRDDYYELSRAVGTIQYRYYQDGGNYVDGMAVGVIHAGCTQSAALRACHGRLANDWADSKQSQGDSSSTTSLPAFCTTPRSQLPGTLYEGRVMHNAATTSIVITPRVQAGEPAGTLGVEMESAAATCVMEPTLMSSCASTGTLARALPAPDRDERVLDISPGTDGCFDVGFGSRAPRTSPALGSGLCLLPVRRLRCTRLLLHDHPLRAPTHTMADMLAVMGNSTNSSSYTRGPYMSSIAFGTLHVDAELNIGLDTSANSLTTLTPSTSEEHVIEAVGNIEMMYCRISGSLLAGATLALSSRACRASSCSGSSASFATRALGSLHCLLVQDLDVDEVVTTTTWIGHPPALLPARPPFIVMAPHSNSGSLRVIADNTNWGYTQAVAGPTPPVAGTPPVSRHHRGLCIDLDTFDLDEFGHPIANPLTINNTFLNRLHYFLYMGPRARHAYDTY